MITVVSAFMDPRFQLMGIRMIIPSTLIPPLECDDYPPVGEDFHDLLRIFYGLPATGKELTDA